jgi:Mg/Co/Ni transporter MgtE
MPAVKKVEMFRLMSDEDREKMVRTMPAEQAREMFALMPQ